MALERTFRPHLKDIVAVQMDAAEGRMPGVHQQTIKRRKQLKKSGRSKSRRRIESR
jgi:hypothetical protein